jgi:hypothetical protein
MNPSSSSASPPCSTPPARPTASMSSGCRSAWPPAPSPAMRRARSPQPTGPPPPPPSPTARWRSLRPTPPARGQRSSAPHRHAVELEADNPNLIGGDQVCGSHHLSQHFLFRPARGHADGSTPIANLHLTGAAVWPGAGTGAGSGFLLARNSPDTDQDQKTNKEPPTGKTTMNLNRRSLLKLSAATMAAGTLACPALPKPSTNW